MEWNLENNKGNIQSNPQMVIFKWKTCSLKKKINIEIEFTVGERALYKEGEKVSIC